MNNLYISLTALFSFCQENAQIIPELSLRA
jgi:hypothetical protein